MYDVGVTYPQKQFGKSLLSTQDLHEHGDEVFSTPAWICWGERIRTSDWLIQNQLPYRLATPQWTVNEVYRSGSN